VRRPTGRPGLTAALAVILLAGCSSSATQGAAAPSSVPPTAVAATPTVAPTPSATPFASSSDEAGAHAFVVAYLAEWDHAFATGDTSKMATYQLASCFCVKAVTEINATYAAGGSYVGARFTILKWAYGDHGPAFARTAVSFQADRIVTKMPGEKDIVEPEMYGHYFLDLRRSGNHWQISAIRLKQVPKP
jgi:hypothetical protein